MTKVAYLECPTGIAGDMCLGALIDAGVPLEYLTEQLQRLGISQEFHLRVERVSRNGQAATKVHVDLLKSDPTTESKEPGVDPHTTFAHPAREEAVAQPSVSRSQSTHSHSAHSHHHPNTTYSHSHQHGSEHSPVSSHSHVHDHIDAAVDHTHQGRHLPEIEQLIRVANLPARASAWSLAVFRRLAEAEGAVHGIAPEAVHFHEVGATDAIVDIVGTCLGLDWLGIETLYCAPLPVGGGTIWAAHGRLPVPTPAVLRLFEMRQVPIYSNGIERELVTPTGAAIATTLATEFGAPPPMRLLKVGLGAGSRDLPIPNILRLWVGESEGRTQRSQQASRPAEEVKPEHGAARETIAVLETQIDDLNPQAIAYTLERLFAAGALDVFTQAIGMKKSRLGTLLTVICHPKQIEVCEEVLFRETTTLGIRRSLQERTILQREIQFAQTTFGAVRIKVARPVEAGNVINVQPEYEDCAQLARQAQVPFLEVHQAALQAWHQGN